MSGGPGSSAGHAMQVRTAPWTPAALRAALRVSVLEGPYARVRAWRKRSEWHPVTVRPGLSAADHVLVTVVKDERPRLPFWLDYYRRLGVQHFLVVDNTSSDGTLDLLAQHDDVSTIRATGSYGESRYAVDWVNGILSRYCVGSWVLWVDADEFLVFSGHDEPLSSLTETLDVEGRRSMQAIMVDMYSDRPASENVLAEHQNPLEVCRLFDGSGYTQVRSRDNRASWIKGGVRQRVFFPERPKEAPALNKTPLVRWSRHYAFMKSVHQVWPSRLNGTTRVGGALLHFKFTSFATAKMTDPTTRAQHTAEYEAYRVVDKVNLTGSETTTYTGPGDLQRLGLVDFWV